MPNLINKTVLAIDDTPAIRTFLRVSLMDHGVDFHEAATASEGVSKCSRLEPDVVVLDLGLPDQDGLEILPRLKSCCKNKVPAVIVLTVRDDRKVKEKAFSLGGDMYVTKPFEMDDLIEALQECAPGQTN
jgi:DNA-binding response OmpR family regulator